MELLELLKQRMDSAAAELSTAEGDFKAVSERLAAIKAKWEAYSNAYSTEAKSVGHTVEVRDTESAGATATETTPTNGHSIGNMTAFIASVIANSRSGVTAVDVWKQVQPVYPNVARNYIYAVLSRLVARQAATIREHRYYAGAKRQ